MSQRTENEQNVTDKETTAETSKPESDNDQAATTTEQVARADAKATETVEAEQIDHAKAAETAKAATADDAKAGTTAEAEGAADAKADEATETEAADDTQAAKATEPDEADTATADKTAETEEADDAKADKATADDTVAAEPATATDDADDASGTADEDEETEDEHPPRKFLPTSRRMRILLAVVLVVILGGGLGGYLWHRAVALPDDAAFRFGDQVVTADQLSDKVETWRAMYGVQPPTGGSDLDKFRRDSAKAYAVDLILQHAAEDKKIVISDKVAQTALTRLISQELGDGTDAHDKFIQELGDVGTSETAVISEIKQQLGLSQLFDTVTKDAGNVSDQEVRNAFVARKNQLATPEQRTIDNIVVRTKADADKVVADLNGGAKFEDLAAQRSIDGATRDKGGSLGPVARSQLEDAYGNAAFSAASGAVFGPIQNQFGWNVGKVVAVTASTPATFDKVQASLKQQLQNEKVLKVWRDWLGAQIRAADVEYADTYRPTDPSAAPDVRPGQSPVSGQPSAQPAPSGPPR